MQKKLDLECRLEDEQMKNASKEMEMEKDKALLVTRVKQLEEHSTSILLQNRLLKVLCVVCVCVCMTIFKDYESFFSFWCSESSLQQDLFRQKEKMNQNEQARRDVRVCKTVCALVHSMLQLILVEFTIGRLNIISTSLIVSKTLYLVQY